MLQYDAILRLIEFPLPLVCGSPIEGSICATKSTSLTEVVLAKVCLRNQS
jgi:hypothetical protein